MFLCLGHGLVTLLQHAAGKSTRDTLLVRLQSAASNLQHRIRSIAFKDSIVDLFRPTDVLWRMLDMPLV